MIHIQSNNAAINKQVINMKNWKNESATKESNIFFAQSENQPSQYGSWVECDENELIFAKYDQHLFTQGGVRYFGRV